MKKMRTGWMLLLAAAVMLLAGCLNKSGDEETAFNPDANATLRVMYSNEQVFNQQYGNMFRAKYPNIDFEIIATSSLIDWSKDPIEQLVELAKEHKPDLLVLTADQYERLAEEGLLYELDTLIRQDRFDVENLTESVLDLIKSRSAGRLYGLAPSFSAQGLFYNKDLFQRYGVTPPRDGMSWEELLQLAARFPTDGAEDTRIYGLAQSLFVQNPFDLARQIAASKGLQLVDSRGSALTLNNAEWRSVFNLVSEAYRSSYVVQPQSPSGGMGGGAVRIGPDGNLFMSGRAAMVIEGVFQLQQFGLSGGLRGASSFDWGVVTVPTDPSYPYASASLTVTNVFAISADSPQVGAAWAFIKYIHSDELAKIRSRSTSELMTRKGYTTDQHGNSLEAFYKLLPDTTAASQLYPKGFLAAFSQIASEEITASSKASKTEEEAFQSLISRAQQALAEAVMSGEMERGGGSAGGMGGALGAVSISF